MCEKLYLLIALVSCSPQYVDGQYEAQIANAKKIGLSTFVKLPEPAIAGDIDDRIVVYGTDGVQHRACNVADDEFQWERWGFGTICQCSKIEYNSAGLNRTPTDISSELDPGDGVSGGAFYSDGAYVDTGLTYIEAGVCVPGPCCEQQYFKSKFPMPWTKDRTTSTTTTTVAIPVAVITTAPTVVSSTTNSPTSVLTEISAESAPSAATTMATKPASSTANVATTTKPRSVTATPITRSGQTTAPTMGSRNVPNLGIFVTTVTITPETSTTSPTTKTARIMLPLCAHPYPWPKTLEAPPPAKFNMTCQYYPDNYHNPKDACKRMAAISEWGYGPYLIYCCSFKWPKDPNCEGPQFPSPVIR